MPEYKRTRIEPEDPEEVRARDQARLDSDLAHLGDPEGGDGDEDES